MRFLFDSSCIVPLVSNWHPEHRRTASAYNRRLDAGDVLLVAGHAAAESYAVLTRMPAPFRLPPSEALELLAANLFRQGSEVLALSGQEYRGVLQAEAKRLTLGGRIYDAVILACAKAGGADELLTLNLRHFEGLDGGNVRIVAP